MKKYEQIENSKTELKIHVYYHLGGMNYFTSKVDPRGYYVSITPVEIERKENGILIESYSLFSGARMLLKETKRKSDKAYNEALQIAEIKLPELKEYVFKSNNIK